MSNSGNTFLALLAGAAIGAGIGLLYAPDSGEETRRRLGDNARRAQDNLNRKYRETSSSLGEKARRAKMDFESRLGETLSSASYKADEILASLETKLDELMKQNPKYPREHPKGGTQSSTTTGQTGSATDNAVV